MPPQMGPLVIGTDLDREQINQSCRIRVQELRAIAGYRLGHDGDTAELSERGKQGMNKGLREYPGRPIVRERLDVLDEKYGRPRVDQRPDNDGCRFFNRTRKI